MNIPESSRIFLKQDLEYSSGPKYAKLQNVSKLWIWQGSQYASVAQHWVCQNMPWQSCEYILGSKYARILNLAGFWICNSYTGFKICHNMVEYVWIWIGLEYAWISEFTIIDRALNISHTIYSTLTLQLISSY